MTTESIPTEATFRVTCVEHPPLLHIALHGELDLHSRTRLPPPERAGPGIRVVIVDLEDLSFCDLRGLRGLLDLEKKHLRLGRSIFLTHAGGQVRRLLELTGYSSWVSG
jgi:anti-anti-sigma factor